MAFPSPSPSKQCWDKCCLIFYLSNFCFSFVLGYGECMLMKLKQRKTIHLNPMFLFFKNQKTRNYTTTIAVDGSLFKKHPKFKGYMEETLRDILPKGNVTLMLSEDGSGKGAALVAAVASKKY